MMDKKNFFKAKTLLKIYNKNIISKTNRNFKIKMIKLNNYLSNKQLRLLLKKYIIIFKIIIYKICDSII